VGFPFLAGQGKPCFLSFSLLMAVIDPWRCVSKLWIRLFLLHHRTSRHAMSRKGSQSDHIWFLCKGNRLETERLVRFIVCVAARFRLSCRRKALYMYYMHKRFAFHVLLLDSVVLELAMM
jgi:hypothetical protein